MEMHWTRFIGLFIFVLAMGLLIGGYLNRAIDYQNFAKAVAVGNISDNCKCLANLQKGGSYVVDCTQWEKEVVDVATKTALVVK